MTNLTHSHIPSYRPALSVLERTVVCGVSSETCFPMSHSSGGPQVGAATCSVSSTGSSWDGTDLGDLVAS